MIEKLNDLADKDDKTTDEFVRRFFPKGIYTLKDFSERLKEYSPEIMANTVKLLFDFMDKEKEERVTKDQIKEMLDNKEID